MEIFLFDTLNKIPQTGAFGDGRGFSGNDSLAIAEGFFFIFNFGIFIEYICDLHGFLLFLVNKTQRKNTL